MPEVVVQQLKDSGFTVTDIDDDPTDKVYVYQIQKSQMIFTWTIDTETGDYTLTSNIDE